MSEHAKPGEGFLSLKAHQRLENFIFVKQTALSIYVSVIIFLIAIIADSELTSYIRLPFSDGQFLNESDVAGWLFLFCTTIISIFYVVTIFLRRVDSFNAKIAAYVLASMIPFWVAVEYFSETLNPEVSLYGWPLVLILYYLTSSFLALLVSVSGNSSLSERTVVINSDYSTPKLVLATVVSLVIGVLFLVVLDDTVYSWAYAVSIASVLWVSIESVFLPEDTLKRENRPSITTVPW